MNAVESLKQISFNADYESGKSFRAAVKWLFAKKGCKQTRKWFPPIFHLAFLKRLAWGLRTALANDTSAVWVGWKKCGAQQNLAFLALFHHKFLSSFHFYHNIFRNFSRRKVFSVIILTEPRYKLLTFLMKGDKLRTKHGGEGVVDEIGEATWMCVRKESFFPI